MEINNQPNNLNVRFSRNNSSRPAENLENASGVEQSVETKPQKLLDRLQGDEKVRDRLVVEIQARVQAGEYQTRAAAEQAAQQIVD